MKIVTVIPLSRGISKEVLTYFTKSDVKLGSIVKIPLRKKIVYGLVTDTEDAKDLKSELRSLSYSIKKIEELKSDSFLSDSFINAVKKIAEYNAGTLGATLFSLIPKPILEENEKLSFPETKIPKDIFHEINLLQAENEERFAHYKSLIREEFARGHSVFFCVPTIEDLLNAKKQLEKGIEKYSYEIHGGLPKNIQIETWQKICEDKHPVLIIGTGSFLSIPRIDVGTIILEKESSRGYKMQTRPFIDIRLATEILAKEMNVRLVLGDILLRVETLWEEKRGKYSNLSPLKFRSLAGSKSEIVDMRSPQNMKTKEFSVLSPKVRELIQKNIENSERLFLFCGRKGTFPTTVCSDCGTTVSCKNCSMPLVLYTKKELSENIKNLFICNHCGERYDTKVLCANCGGWRLNPLGIAVERVFDEILELFPKAKVVVFDKDHITTHKKAEKIRDLFYKTPGAICIGTEMALSYLNEPIENSSVISIDSYFSIPDFQITEKIFHILLEMRSLTMKEFLIQTRQKNTKIFEYAVRGSLADFYNDEIKEREEMGYPPFNTYIKLTLVGDKNAVRREMEKAKEIFLPHKLQIFDAWHKLQKGKHVVNGLLYLEKDKWPSSELLLKIKNLPAYFSVRIDPSSLL